MKTGCVECKLVTVRPSVDMLLTCLVVTWFAVFSGRRSKLQCAMAPTTSNTSSSSSSKSTSSTTSASAASSGASVTSATRRKSSRELDGMYCYLTAVAQNGSGPERAMAEARLLLEQRVHETEMEVGDCHNKTRLVQRLGSGSFGDVYLGLTDDDTQVAVKVSSHARH